jgi:hypothetical protein
MQTDGLQIIANGTVQIILSLYAETISEMGVLFGIYNLYLQYL